MIRLVDVVKYYPSLFGGRSYIYNGLTLDLPMDKDLAILGKNGAGKSTLVRLIGGIESPNSGVIESSCSISWPLGLSTGIQGQMTGRENTEFLCKIYGVSNVAEAHDYVVDFSELGHKYEEIVMNYSSGMKSRLAFSMSIILKFDVILLDEVLSVGDSRFKKKCELALAELRKRGARIILVSHSESSVRRLCQAGLVVDKGTATYFDKVDDAITYFNKNG